MLQISGAKKQHLESISNWMDGYRPVVRSESDWVLHLLKSDDFIALKASDGGEAGLENLLDRVLKKWPNLFSKVFYSLEESKFSSLLTLTSFQRVRYLSEVRSPSSLFIYVNTGENGRRKNPHISAAETEMARETVHVDSCSHVDHSPGRLDIHYLSQSCESCGVLSFYGQHITRYVFHDEDD